MRGFRFRLERVLDLRAAAEEEMGRRVADARRAAGRARSVVDRILRSELALRERVGEALRGTRSVGSVQNLEVVREQLARQRLVAEAELVDAEVALREAVENHRKAHREREILDRLRTRRAAEWQVEERRREQSVLDEVGRGRSGVEGSVET
ncbi:MAG: flagellar export protein FliJ [Gemmatimonadota bacterium]|nr:flagellar export protein FliJ [Gemmatimonadota bacterium]